MLVNVAFTDDWAVEGPSTALGIVSSKIRPFVGKLPLKLFQTTNPVIHSTAVLPSRRGKRLNQANADVLHLHWVNKEMLSIADIGSLRKPVVWTLHDMWGFCGAEHYTEESRWRKGYFRNNRPDYESGYDINRWTWSRKVKHWKKPMHIVTPSQWLANCVRESALMRGWPVTVVPYYVDTERWEPVDKRISREVFGLPTDVPLLLFGATDGGRDPRKGFDLLMAALNHLRDEIQDLNLVVLGRQTVKAPTDLGFPVHYTGRLYDDLSLKVLYSAVDALALPSRQDNLPNTGLEAHACGTPIISFDVGGLPEIAVHRKTGYLAAAFDSEDFAKGIGWVLKNAERHNKLVRTARARAVSAWSSSVVTQGYLDVYDQALKGSCQ